MPLSRMSKEDKIDLDKQDDAMNQETSVWIEFE